VAQLGHPSGLVCHAKDKCRIKDLSLVDQLHDRNLTSFRRSVKSFATVRLANGGLMHRSLKPQQNEPLSITIRSRHQRG
jgi:hypothetical protein